MSARPARQALGPGGGGRLPARPARRGRGRARPAERGAAGGRLAADAAPRRRSRRSCRRLRGDYHEDEWGFDEQFAEAVFPLFEFLYERLVAGRGRGGAQRSRARPGAAGRQPRRLAVPLRRDDDDDGDHEGAPAAAMAALHGPRLGLRAARSSPRSCAACGGVPASPHNAIRLLEQDELVMVFPEGVKGTGKPFSERYRLQRFGRGGFVEVALRTGSPIVPVAVVGSEEIYPKLAESPTARARHRRAVRPDHPDLPLARAARPDPAAVAVADRVLRADRRLRASARGRRRPPARLRPLRAGPRDDPGEALREPGQARLRVPLGRHDSPDCALDG